MARDLKDYAKSMDVEVDELKKALSKYGMDESDLVNQQKRLVLANAINGEWTRDEFKAQYDIGVRDSADWDWDEIVDKFGYSLGLVRKYRDELEPIFKWVTKQLQRGETFENLQSEFNRKISQETSLGKLTSDELLAEKNRWDKAKKVDFKENLTKLMREIRTVAKQKFGDGILDQLDEGIARQMALDLVYEDSAFLGGNFDQGTIERRLRPLANKDWEQGGDEGKITGGEAGGWETQLSAWLSKNGIVTDRMSSLVDRLTAGELTLDQAKQDVRDNEMTRRYAGYSDLFSKGQDASSIAMDYRQVMAQLLEQPLETITIDDSRVQQAMQGKSNPDGTTAPLKIYEFEKQIRQSPEWDKTDNAMRAYTNIGETILKQFGFRG